FSVCGGGGGAQTGAWGGGLPAAPGASGGGGGPGPGPRFGGGLMWGGAGRRRGGGPGAGGGGGGGPWGWRLAMGRAGRRAVRASSALISWKASYGIIGKSAWFLRLTPSRSARRISPSVQSPSPVSLS